MNEKLETGNSKLGTLEELLKAAGFQTVETRGEKILVASGAADFGKSHAAFLQSACNHPALLGASRLDQLGGPVMLVHRTSVETVAGETAAVPEAEIVNPQSEIENAD